nr:hypothetical protein [Tanacetum cinerariifolium]
MTNGVSGSISEVVVNGVSRYVPEIGVNGLSRLWLCWISFDYRVTLGFGSITGGLDHVNPAITLSIEHGISIGTRVGTMAGVDINTLTMEQYLALSQENQAPGVVKLEIRGNVNFEIKSQFMRELREDTFFENKNKDSHDHVDRVLNIVSLFNIPGVSQDAVLLRVFPFTLNGSAKRWVDRLTLGAVNTWDLLKKPLSKGSVHHPRPLNDLKTSTTSSRKAMNHYTKLGNGIMICYISANPRHKQPSKGRDMKKLKENIHAIQVWCQICEGPHLDKECPLNEEVKHVEEVNYGEFGHHTPFNESNGAKFRVGPPGYYTRTDNQTPSREKKPNLIETINKYMEGVTKRQAEQDEWLKTFC